MVLGMIFFQNLTHQCLDSSLYHFLLSLKCISKDRLVDGYNDYYYYKEDELFNTCQSNLNKCLSMIAVNDGKKDCQNRGDVFINRAPYSIHLDGFEAFYAFYDLNYRFDQF
ncbi:unnamed protein product [Adineta steineri]|uniref:Uncharacterized protein n=1 Tax=Adineta steineri TaxID=433720 RepID=A0A819SXE9_9BILA|nr:unnamed protein product [Adineta steineri]